MLQNSHELGKKIIANIHRLSKDLQKPIKLMHICGTHEHTIMKNGIRGLLPKNVEIICGPGCPVCVCPTSDLDIAIKLSKRENVIITTFGDMQRVPSSTTSFYEMNAQGSDIRTVYGPHDAVELARNNPDKEIIFFSIGFETTVPLPAFELAQGPPENFSIISAHKLVPPAMDVLLNLEDTQIDGFLLPGHVCTIIGSDIFKPYAEEYKSAMVVGGFDPNDVLISVFSLLKQVIDNDPKVENLYTRVTRNEGNIEAQKIIEEVFAPCDSHWRGLGMIPKSGLEIRPHLEQHDALKKFEFDLGSVEEYAMPTGCACADVLMGKISPQDCPLFGTKCTPRNPVGPCMVSHEGSCKISYTFNRQ